MTKAQRQALLAFRDIGTPVLTSVPRRPGEPYIGCLPRGGIKNWERQPRWVTCRLLHNPDRVEWVLTDVGWAARQDAMDRSEG